MKKALALMLATLMVLSMAPCVFAVEPNVEPTKDMATIMVTVGDVWGDGTGYQMLLDADANAFESGIIPWTGPLTEFGDASDAVYAEFEYTLPENADGALDTTNILCEETATLEIPAGTYDFCFTNPVPGDRMWIADGVNDNGVMGRADNFAFDAGLTYRFTIKRDADADYDDVVLIIEQTEPGPALSVSLNYEAATMEPGETLQLIATMVYPNTTSVISGWTSSNPSVATVDGNGFVTAVAIGSTTITVETDNGLTATCEITVASIAEALNGPGMNFTYNNDPENEWIPDATTFTNRNVGATTLKGYGAGSTTLSLTVDLEADELFVFDWFVSSAGLTEYTEDSTQVGSSWYAYVMFTANDEFVFASKGNYDITANSLPLNANTMNTYIFTPTEAGEYTFAWTYYKNSGSVGGLDAFFLDNCMVTTTGPATEVIVDPTEAEIMDVQTVQLTATVLPITADDFTVTWSSSDSSVATVDENGLVSGVGAGVATITATSNSDPSISASATITVISSEEANRELREALNVEGGSLPFLNDEVYPWVIDDTSFEGRMTAKSAIEGMNSTTSSVTLNIEAEQGQTMTFDWFVSSESGNYDYLAFYVNDTLIERISGVVMTDFESYSYQISEDGIYNFTWTYSKDVSMEGGLDAGWLDEVELVGTTEPPEDTYTVTFYDWDGSELAVETVNSGADATPPTDPSREGYIFLGWEGNYTNVTSDESVYAVYRLIGDANGDGSLNTGDAAYILRYAIDLVDMTPEALLVADVNGDGMVNTGDAAKLLELVITAR